MKKTKRALVTGAAGFVGRFLCGMLREQGFRVFATDRIRPAAGLLCAAADFIEADLLKPEDVKKAVVKSSPDVIFHLAAQSVVSTSWEIPGETIIANTVAPLNLFRAVISARISPVIHLAGSSDEYGHVLRSEIPVKETNALRPSSPYAVSKIAQSYLGHVYWKSHGLKILRTRAFNHTGPGRADIFSTSSFAKQVAMAEAGLIKPEILVGDLSPVRDFMDVRDVCRAYILLAQKGKPGEIYNVSSGSGLPVRTILRTILSFSKTKITIKVERSRLRPSDNMCLVGDNSKLRKLGWKRTISLEESLLELLNEWRVKLRA